MCYGCRREDGVSQAPRLTKGCRSWRLLPRAARACKRAWRRSCRWRRCPARFPAWLSGLVLYLFGHHRPDDGRRHRIVCHARRHHPRGAPCAYRLCGPARDSRHHQARAPCWLPKSPSSRSRTGSSTLSSRPICYDACAAARAPLRDARAGRAGRGRGAHDRHVRFGKVEPRARHRHLQQGDVRFGPRRRGLLRDDGKTTRSPSSLAETVFGWFGARRGSLSARRIAVAPLPTRMRATSRTRRSPRARPPREPLPPSPLPMPTRRRGRANLRAHGKAFSLRATCTGPRRATISTASSTGSSSSTAIAGSATTVRLLRASAGSATRRSQ